MKQYKTVALLPIKKNSERIKGKNFKEFAGKPLFHWILDTLLSVPSIDKILINTDARESLIENNIHSTDKIIIRDRKEHLLGDDTSMNLIIEDDINFIDSKIYLMTHTTNPLLKSNTISESLKVYENQDKNDSLFTVNKVQSRFYDSEKKPVNHDPNNLLKTQDLPLWFEENSCLYIFSKSSFKKTNARIGLDPLMFPIAKSESFDIDEIDDWDMAESIMKGRHS
tara:strand:- start:1558 stop:2232 length:675 start_codon:yes stop_codon:yes gene_type:complete